jgi:hypothetical protein
VGIASAYSLFLRAFPDAAYSARRVAEATCIAVSPRFWAMERSFAGLDRNRHRARDFKALPPPSSTPPCAIRLTVPLGCHRPMPAE